MIWIAYRQLVRDGNDTEIAVAFAGQIYLYIFM